MGSFGEWREQPWDLPEVDLRGFSIATIGATISTWDGRRVISVVVDDHVGTAVVLLLTDAQVAALDAGDDADPECIELAHPTKRFHNWLRNLDLDDNEIIGTHIDPIFAGFVIGDGSDEERPSAPEPPSHRG